MISIFPKVAAFIGQDSYGDNEMRNFSTMYHFMRNVVVKSLVPVGEMIYNSTSFIHLAVQLLCLLMLLLCLLML